MATITKQWGEGFASGELYTVLNNFNGMAADATVTAGATHTDTIATTIQLKDWNGDDLTEPACVWAYLASDADGLNMNATALTTEMSIGTDGSIAVILANVAYLLVSEADGDIDVTMGYTTGAKNFYLVVVLPTGKRVVSDVLAFTA